MSWLTTPAAMMTSYTTPLTRPQWSPLNGRQDVHVSLMLPAACPSFRKGCSPISSTEVKAGPFARPCACLALLTPATTAQSHLRSGLTHIQLSRLYLGCITSTETNLHQIASRAGAPQKTFLKSRLEAGLEAPVWRLPSGHRKILKPLSLNRQHTCKAEFLARTPTTAPDKPHHLTQHGLRTEV